MSEDDLLSELLDQEEQSSENSIDSNTSESTNSETTQENSSSEEVGDENQKPASEKPQRGKPWVDYLPELEYKIPETLVERLEDHYLTSVEILKVKELYVLATLDQEIHDAYYRNWVRDANRLFRIAVKTKKKIAKLRKNQEKPA